LVKNQVSILELIHLCNYSQTKVSLFLELNYKKTCNLFISGIVVIISLFLELNYKDDLREDFYERKEEK
jgi:hypothetical protein